MERRDFLNASLAGLAATGLGATAPAAAVERSGPWLDLRAFGARGNGHDDDTGPLRRALNEARRRRLPLFVPPGHFMVGGEGVTLSGQGLRLEGIPGRSMFHFRGGRRFLRVEEAEDITLYGLRFNGRNRKPEDQDGLLELVQSSDLRLQACDFVHGGGHGVHGMECQGLEVNGCEIDHLGDYGLLFEDCRDLRIQNCRVQRCGNNGIVIHRSERGAVRALVAHNFVSSIRSQFGDGQNGNGINAFRSDEVVITGNQLQDCRFSAIRINSCSNPVITGNQCRRCDEVALFVEFAHIGAVVAQNLIDEAVQGISVTNLDEGGRLANVQGNLLRNIRMTERASNPGSGLAYGISVEADTLVQGNLVEMGPSDAPHFGILAGWGSYLRNVMISDNQIRNAHYGISVSVAEGAGRTRIAGNMVVGALKQGICGNRWEETLGIDLTDASGRSRFAHVQLSDNWVL